MSYLGPTDYPPPVYGQEVPALGAPPPRRSGVGVIVAVIVAAVVAGGVGLVAVSKDHSVSGTAVAAAGSSTSVAPTTTTTTTTKVQPRGARLSHTDYEGPWDFRMGGVELHADSVDGRDHDSCLPIEKAGKLTELGCEYAAELVLSAEDGGLYLTQFIVAMPDEATAEAAAAEISDTDLTLRPGTYVDGFETGKWRAGAQKEFVVITFATATSAVPVDTVQTYLRYRHVDITSAILFR